MTPDQIAYVERSFRIVAPLSEMAGAIFYERLFSLDPALHRLFRHADMGEQGRKLMAALAFTVENLRRPERLAPVAVELGRRHAGHGVEPGHYDTFGAALQATLAEALGDGFNPPVRDAWAAAFALLVGIMQAARPAQAA
jgi:nitric oxide dioxygenase